MFVYHDVELNTPNYLKSWNLRRRMLSLRRCQRRVLLVLNVKMDEPNDFRAILV